MTPTGWKGTGPGFACSALVLGLFAVHASSRLDPVSAAGLTEGGGITEPNLKVAFIGDDGSGSNTTAVLQLILNEGADLVLDQGDFDYDNNPTLWDNTISSVLGPDFPYFASVGNHDTSAFYGAGGYQEKLLARLALLPPGDVSCSGDLGVKAACTYKGLFFVLSGVGTLGSGHEAYLDQQLAADQSVWRICSWHKNQNAMQVGAKTDEVGWLAYETCLAHGAIIATAHEHSYSRTKTLVSMQNQTADPDQPSPIDLRMAPGATFAFVSGLGGRSIRDQERCLPGLYPYGCNGEWASIYTSTQGAQYGALFIEFNVDGDPNKARGYFKNVSGVVIDEFEVTSQLALPPDPSNSAPELGTVAITGDALLEGATVSLQAGFTDLDAADTHTATILWGDGTVETGVVSEAGGTGTVSGMHAYPDNGTYTATVVVRDSPGSSDSGTATVALDNVPPAASVGGPYTGVAGSPISFSGSATDPGTADVLTYQWDLDNDGSFEATGQTVTRTFTSPGTYTVTLRVADDDGGSDLVTTSVPVSPAPTTDVRLYFSLQNSATLGGLSVDNEDIVAFDGAGFSLYFDGSDVGAASFVIDAFAILSPTELLVSFTSAGTVGGVAMDDSDILKFTGTFGPTTTGTFSMFFDGSDVGLTSSDEDVDAIELLPNGHLLVSTTGSFSVAGVSGADEDVITFAPTSLGATTAGTWAMYFDGSDVGLASSSSEDVDGVAIDAAGRIYLSTAGSFSVPGVSGADEDVFVFTPSSLGPTTAGTFAAALFFDGSLHFGSNDIFAIDLP